MNDDRPAQGIEIELTPQMLRRAANALAQFDPAFATLNEGAERVVRTALEEGGYNVRGT